MAQYQYLAATAEGKRIKGRMTAQDEAEVQMKLHEQALYLVHAKAVKESGKGRQLKPKQLAEFNRQIGTLLEAGLTLVKALGIITTNESISKGERQVYQAIARQLRQGVSLSEAMEETGRFPALMTAMYRSAENSGNLDQVALQLAVQYDKTDKLNAKIKSASLYPKFLLVVLVVIVTIIVKFILPRFMKLFSNMEGIPASTRALLYVSTMVEDHGLLLLGAIILLVLGVRAAFMVPAVRIAWDKLKLKAVIVGSLNQTVATSRFARTLSSLYSAGIPIVSALQISRKTIGNAYIDMQFDKMISYVKAGNNLSDGIDGVDGFLHKLSDSVRVGEETGKLDSMLASTAQVMEYDADIAITKLVSLLEPCMIIVMGLIVAFIMVSVYSALMGSYTQLGAF